MDHILPPWQIDDDDARANLCLVFHRKGEKISTARSGREESVPEIEMLRAELNPGMDYLLPLTDRQRRCMRNFALACFHGENHRRVVHRAVWDLE